MDRRGVFSFTDVGEGMASFNSLPRCKPVVVEYDSARGKRATKTFTDPYAARRFWVLKDAAGKNPRIVSSR